MTRYGKCLGYLQRIFRVGWRRLFSIGFSASASNTSIISSLNSAPNPGCRASYQAAATVTSCSISRRNSTRHFINEYANEVALSFLLAARRIEDFDDVRQGDFPPRIDLPLKVLARPIRERASSTTGAPSVLTSAIPPILLRSSWRQYIKFCQNVEL